MSLLIKGLKMPTSCLKGCPIDGINCRLWEDKYWASYEDPEKGRHRDCPLIELPDHGDLIDREYAVGSACSGRIRALPTTEDGEDWIRVEEVRQSLKSVPAVIPAERSEDA